MVQEFSATGREVESRGTTRAALRLRARLPAERLKKNKLGKRHPGNRVRRSVRRGKAWS